MTMTIPIAGIFKESDGTWSWARVYSTFTGSSAIWAFIHQVAATSHIPDAATLAGLAGWAIHGYATNKAITAFGKPENL